MVMEIGVDVVVTLRGRVGRVSTPRQRALVEIALGSGQSVTVWLDIAKLQRAQSASTEMLAPPQAAVVTKPVLPATEPQIKAIYAIARGAQAMDDSETDARCVEVYGVPVAQLSRRQASDSPLAYKGEPVTTGRTASAQENRAATPRAVTGMALPSYYHGDGHDPVGDTPPPPPGEASATTAADIAQELLDLL